MPNYLLDNYNLTKLEVLKSFVVSEYGLRHLAQAKTQTQHKWGHRIIAAIELCPIVGLIATLIEAIVARCIKSYSPQSIPQEKWLFKGSQASCLGQVSVSKVESIRAKLDSQSPLSICFNREKITDSLKGGTCTAMSLEFLEEYFKSKEANLKKDNFQSKMVESIIKFAPKFFNSCEEMRNRQAAFNTIEVKKLNYEVDYSKNKVQALANYHSFVIDYASNEIETDKLTNEHDIHSLPEGSFLIRILKPANNEKLEEHGHSLVYIKEHGIGIFYDPNFGVKNLSPSEHQVTLFENFKTNLNTFQVNKVRFYRLQPSSKSICA